MGNTYEYIVKNFREQSYTHSHIKYEKLGFLLQKHRKTRFLPNGQDSNWTKSPYEGPFGLNRGHTCGKNHTNSRDIKPIFNARLERWRGWHWSKFVNVLTS